MPKTVLYFAYGSDMSLRQIRQRLLDAEIVLSEDCRCGAKLTGWELRFDKATSQNPTIGLAAIHKLSEGTVEGVLYEIPHSALTVLDSCEKAGDTEESEYQRQTVEVVSSEKGTQLAHVYVPNPERCKPGLKPSRNHLYRLLAAEQFLSAEYFARLKKTESIKIPVDDDGMPFGPKEPT